MVTCLLVSQMAKAQIAFMEGPSYPVCAQPISLITVDLNQDERLDAAVVCDGDSTVGILLARLDGTFSPFVSVSTNIQPVSLASGDFDGDGQNDIAVAGRIGMVSIWLGTGAGTFTSDFSQTVKASPYSIASSDLDVDGIPDVVTANYLGPEVSTFKGNGNGTLQPATSFEIAGPPWESVPQSVVATDLSSDGIPDLVIANGAESAVVVLLGLPNGGYSQLATLVAPGVFTTSLALADLNHDTNSDIIVGNWDTTVSVFLGEGAGVFQPPVAYATGTSNTSGNTGLAVADFNGDGHVDVAASAVNSKRISILEGRGDGSFYPAYVFTTPSNRSGPRELSIADIDGNGRPDIVYVGSQFGDTEHLVQTMMNDVIFLSDFSGQ